VLAYGVNGEPSRRQADEAFAAQPSFGSLADVRPTHESDLDPDLKLGALLLAAGRLDEAEERLARKASACVLTSIVPARYLLGRVQEGKREIPAACESYGDVVRRWAEAKPGSITPELAKSNAKKLGCAAPHVP